ncbi:hypothetical protein Bca101_043423 [Brassica carinata]
MVVICLQVYDLTDRNTVNCIRYGLAFLETFAAKGDDYAREGREKMQVMVAGGDGTSGWVRPSLLSISRNLCP